MARDDSISSQPGAIGPRKALTGDRAGAAADDPVRVRRAMVARWNHVATRAGYLLYLIAIVMFFVALLTDFTSGKVTIVTTSMIVGSLLLAPAIVIGYAVKAAEKDDIERGL